jgi:hypothetical protein
MVGWGFVVFHGAQRAVFFWYQAPSRVAARNAEEDEDVTITSLPVAMRVRAGRVPDPQVSSASSSNVCIGH